MRPMCSRRILVSAFAAAMFFALNASSSVAQGPIDSRTEFTFSSSVEMPGTTLPPGTYVFRIADPNTSRTVMQVMDKGSNKTYGLFLTISAIRPKPSDDAELRFLETPAGKPAAVKTWWYPGNSTGREFIYPKAQARKLAAATNSTVLTTKAETADNSQIQDKELTYMSATGQETQVSENTTSNSSAGAVGTSGRSSRSDLDRTPAQQSQSASTMTSRQRLPHTGTE